MKKVGYIEKVSHDLSPDVWRKLIDEIPELERATTDASFNGLLHAYLIHRNERIGEFEWSDEEDEIVVRGELEDVQILSERIATRLGGRFMPSL